MGIKNQAGLRRVLLAQGTRGQAGMTLVEILIVIAILGVLSVSVGFGVVKFLGTGKIKSAKLQLENVKTVLESWTAANNGEFPDELDTLTKGRGKVIKKKKLKDPWGQRIRYTKPEGDGDPVLCSNGPDKQPDTDDDICIGKEDEEEDDS